MRFWLLACIALAAPAQTLRLHPDNPRYYEFQNKPTVLVTSAEHYGALLNLDFDFVKYLDTLAAQGMNLTRIFTGAYREFPGDFNIAGNTLAPAEGRYITPWRETSAGKWNLDEWNPAYFERLHAGPWSVEWVHPRSGKTEAGGHAEHKGGVWRVSSPPYQEDVALVVTIR